MPLKPGCDEATISANIGELMSTGKYDADQAAAIAYNNCREGKKLYAAPAPVGIFSRVKEGITVYRGADNQRFMLIVTSNSYKDRDNEAIATKALQRYVDGAWTVEDKCLPRNKFLFWHDEKAHIGNIVWADMEGPFLLEVAKELPNRRVTLSTRDYTYRTTVKALWDFIEQSNFRWGASHGFNHMDSAKTKDGVYQDIRKFETSVLPLDAAANPYTFAGVVDAMNKDQVLNSLLKIDGAAEKFRKGIRAVKRDLDKRGLEHKALEETVVKGIMEDCRAMCEKIAGKFTDNPSPELIDQCTEMCLQMLASMGSEAGETTPEETPAETEYMAEDMPAEDVPVEDDEERKPMMTDKQVKLFHRLIKSQETMVNDNTEMRDAVTKMAKAFESLSDIPDTVNKLAGRIEAIEKKLNAPRRASTDVATMVEDKELTQRAKEQTERYEQLFPGLNVKIKSAPENGRE